MDNGTETRKITGHKRELGCSKLGTQLGIKNIETWEVPHAASKWTFFSR